MNLLMCAEVGTLLRPAHQLYIRCAGRVGMVVVEELFIRHALPLCVEVPLMGYDVGVGTTCSLTDDDPPSSRCGTTHVPLGGLFVFPDEPKSLLLSADSLPDPDIIMKEQHKQNDVLVLVITHSALRRLSEASIGGVQLKVRRWCDLARRWETIRYVWGGSDNAATSLNYCPSMTLPSLLHLSIATRVVLEGFEPVRTIQSGFMSDCSKLREVIIDDGGGGGRMMLGEGVNNNNDNTSNNYNVHNSSSSSSPSSQFQNATAILHTFMARCPSLTQLDLTPLSNITTIGDGFLTHSGLQYLDLASFSKLTTVGDNFLLKCSSLISINLQLPVLSTIGKSFMANCSKLISVDFAHLGAVKSIGAAFMAYCLSLSAPIDLSPLREVRTVGPRFLAGCRKAVDISPLVVNLHLSEEDVRARFAHLLQP